MIGKKHLVLNVIMKMNKKRIGILMDGVIRNLGSKVALTFARRFPDRPFDEVIDQYKPFSNLPLESDEFLEFICDSALEIYGKADYTYTNAVRDLNQMVQVLEPEGYEIVLIARDYYKVRPATLFFLSESGCEVSDIKFVKTPVSAWESCDILITGNYDMVDFTPESKELIYFVGEEGLNMDSNHRTIGTLRDAITIFKPDAFSAALPEGTVDVVEEITEENFQDKLDSIIPDYDA
jgi:hypothetical protein